VTEPTAPNIPADAPQDVKDFFDCRGSILNWQSGEVTWLGLKVTPSVSFAPGAGRGGVNVTVSVLGGMVSFTLPASVNAAGELVVDTSSVPDLSEWGIGGRPDIDAAIKRINDWFKHNGKKLKPARLAGGTVVLEKVPIAPVAATVPATAPVTPKPPTPAPPPPPPATTTPPPTGCALWFLMLLMLFGVITVGAGVGFVYFGDPGVGAAPTATPSATQTAPPTATPVSSSTAVPSITVRPSITPVPTVTPQPTATPTNAPQSGLAGICAQVVHKAYGSFLSYIEWLMYWDGLDVDHFVVTVAGANNGEPLDLVFDSVTGAWSGRLGLMQPGEKRIGQVVAVLDDGTPLDITQDVIEILGEILGVRYPQQDSFGDRCLE
jgi:hypothetical protein